MAVFAYIYHQSFVVAMNLSVETILGQVWQHVYIFYYSIERILLKLSFPMRMSLLVDILQILMNLTLEEQQSLFMKLGQIINETMTAQS